jgi:uncharacterized membrane-anchored protein YhcB (DUF1043 family)
MRWSEREFTGNATEDSVAAVEQRLQAVTKAVAATIRDTAALRAEIAQTYRRLSERISAAPKTRYFSERASHLDLLAQRAARFARREDEEQRRGRARTTSRLSDG